MTEPEQELVSTAGGAVAPRPDGDRGWLLARPAPVAWTDAVLLDLDGVVYVGPAAVPHAVATLAAVGAHGVRVAYVTNNASRPPSDVAAHLADLGIEVEPEDVVTSAQAGARLVRERVPAGGRVLAVGGPGVAEALRARGLAPVQRDADEPVAVMQGYGPDVSWRELAEAAYAVGRGVPWIATNGDRTIPTPRGIAPGNGALLAVVTAATGRDPDAVAGKPYPALVAESVERTAARRPLMVGDRLDTDIEGAVRYGMESLLVLTGVTRVRDLLAAAPEHRPTMVARDLRGLLGEHPAPTEAGDCWRCGASTATVVDGVLTVSLPTADPDPVAALDALRAAAAACWAAADHGVGVDSDDAAARLEAALAEP